MCILQSLFFADEVHYYFCNELLGPIPAAENNPCCIRISAWIRCTASNVVPCKRDVPSKIIQYSSTEYVCIASDGTYQFNNLVIAIEVARYNPILVFTIHITRIGRDFISTVPLPDTELFF
ncbi:hypothetical protein D3C74_322350 [compost metagenome]